MRFLGYISALFLLFGFAACTDSCPYDSEPQAYITFYQPNSSGISQVVNKQYDSVYGIGSQRLIATMDDKESSYLLPLPMNEDSAKFVFVEYNGQHDTLALAYTRHFDYTNSRCGLSARIGELRLNTAATTFSQVALRDTATNERSTLTRQRIGVWIDITFM